MLGTLAALSSLACAMAQSMPIWRTDLLSFAAATSRANVSGISTWNVLGKMLKCDFTAIGFNHGTIGTVIPSFRHRSTKLK